jgi:dihydroflavonol-4-reductase
MILVTGATGHIGNVLVRQLLEKKEHVRVLILPGENLSSLIGAHVDVVVGDILDPTALEKAFEDIDTVYHLASLVSITSGKEELLWRVNVDGTQNMLDAAMNADVKRFVYTSSIHAIERPPAGVSIDETRPFDDNNPAGPYDRTKAAASLRVLEASKKGLDTVLVCPTGVIGPFDFKRSELGELILDWMKPQVSVLIDGKFDFVDVRDVAAGHIAAARHGRAGETYILGGHQITLNQFRTTIQEFVGKHTPSIVLPFPTALMAAELAAIYYRISHTRPKFTKYAVETLMSNSEISSEKAFKELGFHQRPITDTIRDTVDWWKLNQSKVKSTLRA